MKVIPAIDLLDGKAVRLSQGRRESAKAYSEDPPALAREFIGEGAQWLHVVDLNAAFEDGDNLVVIKELAESGAKLQVGGGVRTVEQARAMLDAGAERVVIGTKAVDARELRKFISEIGTKAWVACDARQGSVVTKGWTNRMNLRPEDLLSLASSEGVGGIIVTDVSSDGLAKGVSKEFFSKMRAATKVQLYAAGGVGSLDDLRALAEWNYDGAIVGRALYEGRFSLAQALEAVEENAC